MSLLSSAPFRVLLIMTVFIVLIGGFSWYMATLQYERDTAHLQFVDPNNDLWNRAKEQSKTSIDTLYSLYPQYPTGAFVKFSNEGASGFQEDVWAQVIDLGPGFVKIQIQPKYLTEKNSNPERELSTGRIIDWMVQLPDGNIRGGYTTQALLKLENAKVANDSLEVKLSLFLDKLQ